MVGGDVVAELQQQPRSAHRTQPRRIRGQAVEVRWPADVVGRRFPAEAGTARCVDRLPDRRTVGDPAIGRRKQPGHHMTLDHGADLVVGRPEFGQADRPAVSIQTERIAREIDVDRARDRIRHHQRRRSKVGPREVRVHPSIEVAIAGEHPDPAQALSLHRGNHVGLEQSRVADAGHAAEPCDVEAQCIEVFLQPGRRQVARHHARARRQ